MVESIEKKKEKLMNVLEKIGVNPVSITDIDMNPETLNEIHFANNASQDFVQNGQVVEVEHEEPLGDKTTELSKEMFQQSEVLDTSRWQSNKNGNHESTHFIHPE